MPQTLEVARDAIGLPMPDTTSSLGSSGSSDSVRRRVGGNVAADLPAVLAFLSPRTRGAQLDRKRPTAPSSPTDDVTLNFSSADQTATLTLGRKYDLTVVSLVTQVKEAALAARARAKKEADAKFMSDAAATAQQLIAADEARRVAQAASLSDAPLRALADMRPSRCRCRKAPRT